MQKHVMEHLYHKLQMPQNVATSLLELGLIMTTTQQRKIYNWYAVISIH